ncbi:DM13 domain-containing protein [Candidatus Nitrosotenuis aquarius]|uniref:DM13 domain-containing protein n=1 Tax=Candidatus Nitrosotenuis aquarius TaxID=1846278 RepID=UPI000C1EFFFF|nr:DM13 domain-containing protein [Candidatus Nitrosotenuis aquarius]
MLRTVTISVIIGTFLIGSYYVVAASYVQPKQQNKLGMALSDIRPDLTYEKFIGLDEDEKSFLIQTMPSSTRNLILEEARERPSFAAESKDIMTEISGSSELRMIKLTPVSGVKGYDAGGQAAVYVSGKTTFLRLQDFGIASGIDQKLYLTKDGTIETGIEIGPLRASQGDQNYDISGIDHDTYNTLVIYSKPFDLYYGYAKFVKPEG